MKKLLITSLVVLFTFPFVNAQTERINDYSFVVVPKRFDFQFEEDQYQLNSLLKFLFNKYGFHAYYENELPNVSRCSGLWAEVTGKAGFIWNEVTIFLKDCDGVILYKSTTGKSKIKEYGPAYNEALRMAFESISVLGVNQKEIQLLINPEASEDNTAPSNRQAEKKEDSPLDALNLPVGVYTNYSQGGGSYLLKKTKEGYTFYKEHQDAEEGLSYVGKLFVVEGVLFFEDADKTRYEAKFDEEANFSLSRDGMTKTYTKN